MTHALRRRIVLLCAVAAAALGGHPVSPAFAGGDNTAVAVNTKDNSSIFRLAFNIRRVTADVVDQTNAAVAISSCQECRTVAIAIQVLIAESDPSVVAPQNLALAMNVDCTLCDTFAYAYQIVLGDGTRLRFTPEGNRSIAEIRKELKDLRKQDLSDDELATRLGEIVDRLKGVLSAELVGVGKPEPAPGSQPPATTSTTPAPTTTTPGQAAPAPAQTTTTPAQTTTAPASTTTTPAQTTTAPASTTTTPAAP